MCRLGYEIFNFPCTHFDSIFLTSPTPVVSRPGPVIQTVEYVIVYGTCSINGSKENNVTLMVGNFHRNKSVGR